MSGEAPHTVILYRQGDQDYITFGNSQPIEVKVVDSVPLEMQGQAQQISPPDLGVTTQYIVVPSTETALDSVAMAGELGRLDLVSLLLGAIGLLVVFAGLFAFGFIRGQASAIATKAAEQILNERFEALFAWISAIEERTGAQTNPSQTDFPIDNPSAAKPETEFDDGTN